MTVGPFDTSAVGGTTCTSMFQTIVLKNKKRDGLTITGVWPLEGRPKMDWVVC